MWPSTAKEKRLQKEARLGSDLEPLGLFDDAPVTGGAQILKMGWQLHGVKCLIEEYRRERKALEKDKNRSLREGQKRYVKTRRVALLISLKRIGVLRCSGRLSVSDKERCVQWKSGDRSSSSNSKRVKKTRKAGDRSSSSNIEWVKARKPGDRSSASESSVFHQCSATSGDTRNERARYADRHPGMLVARMLQRMSDKLGRDGRRPRLGSSRQSSSGKRLPSPSGTLHLPEHVVASRKGGVHLGRGYRPTGAKSVKKGCGPLVPTMQSTGHVHCRRSLGACEASGSHARADSPQAKKRAHACQGVPRRNSYQVLPQRCERSRETPRKLMRERGTGLSLEGSPGSEGKGNCRGSRRVRGSAAQAW